MSKTKRISCGDWHLGWGYSGNDKIGKLTLNDDGTFTWKGRSQGRHGSKWNHGAMVKFSLLEDTIEVLESKGSAPRNSELISSANELKLMA